MGERGGGEVGVRKAASNVGEGIRRLGCERGSRAVAARLLRFGTRSPRLPLHTTACAALPVLKSFNLPNLWGLDRLGAPLLRGKGPLVEPSWQCTYYLLLGM